MARALVTGGFGQIGSDLVPALVERYRGHADSCVVVLGHSRLPVTREQAAERGFILETGDVRDGARMRELIQQHRITVVYHLASLLSAVGERDPALTFDVNVNGLRVLLDVAVELGGQLRVFWASSIAVFGASTPRDNTPQDTVTAPSTMYGITKVTGELLCAYYHRRYGVDVRSLRYPGLISWKEEPGGGTTDFAVAIFIDALKSNSYRCFVRSDTMLPMMYMPDAIRATLDIMEAPSEQITVRTSYNLAALSFSAEELAATIASRLPGFTATYEPDFRQAIADSWPRSIDDSRARQDWNWRPECDLDRMVDDMLLNLKQKLGL